MLAKRIVESYEANRKELLGQFYEADINSDETS